VDDDQKEIVAVVPIEDDTLAGRERLDALVVRSPDEVAGEISRLLSVISERLALESPHPATAKRVRGARTVPRGFVLSLLAAAERRPDLLPLARFNTTRARDVLQSGDALKLLSEQAAMFLARLNYTYEARWAEVVADALNTFAVASIFAQDPNQADLAAEVENLRKQLGRKGGRKKKEKPPKEE
jgi:hypothetical protein